MSEWLNYDVKLHTKAANDPSIRRDVCDAGLWLEYMTVKKQRNHNVGHTLIVVPITIFLKDVLFIHHLEVLEFQTQELQTLDQELGGKPQGTHLTPEEPSSRC